MQTVANKTNSDVPIPDGTYESHGQLCIKATDLKEINGVLPQRSWRFNAPTGYVI